MNIAGPEGSQVLTNIVEIDDTSASVIDLHTQRFAVNFANKTMTMMPACSWRTCKTCQEQGTFMSLVQVLKILTFSSANIILVFSQW